MTHVSGDSCHFHITHTYIHRLISNRLCMYTVIVLCRFAVYCCTDERKRLKVFFLHFSFSIFYFLVFFSRFTVLCHRRWEGKGSQPYDVPFLYFLGFQFVDFFSVSPFYVTVFCSSVQWMNIDCFCQHYQKQWHLTTIRSLCYVFQ